MKIKLLFFILFLFSIQFLQAQSGLIRHYQLNANANESVSGLNGTINGGVVACSDESSAPSSAMEFNGTDAYIDIPVAGIINLNEYTYSICLKITDPIPSSTAWSILSIGNSNKDQVVYLSNGGPSGQNGFGFGSYNISSTAADDIYKRSLPTVDQWYHLTAVRTKKSIKLFIDDIFIDSMDVTDSIAGYDSSPMARIGSRSGTSWGVQFFKGQIADLKIFNRALNFDEINNLCDINTSINPSEMNSHCIPTLSINNGIQLNNIECTLDNFKFCIYNTLGVLVYETSNPSFNWSIPTEMNSSMYIYKMEGNMNGKYFSKSKSFTIVR